MQETTLGLTLIYKILNKPAIPPVHPVLRSFFLSPFLVEGYCAGCCYICQVIPFRVRPYGVADLAIPVAGELLVEKSGQGHILLELSHFLDQFVPVFGKKRLFYPISTPDPDHLSSYGIIGNTGFL